MGLWAGIKHALNSTLGTEDFIPLDKLIKGQRTLAASDTTIAVLFTTENPVLNQEYSCSFIPKTDGVIRLKAYGYGTSNSSQGYIYVYENGERKASFLIETGTETRIMDISVTKNSIYTFGRNSYVRIYEFSIGAQIVDGSLFEVNPVS